MSRKSVALLIESSNAYARGLLDGIIQWQREHESWSIFIPEQERGAAPPHWLATWKGDGIIARIETDEIADTIRSLKIPTVDVSAARFLPDIPWVETNDRAIAEIAVQHLIERGFRDLAFCGEPHFNWSQLRERAFREVAIASEVNYHLFASKSRFDLGYSWTHERERLAKWIQALPRPIGILACYDIKGQQILDVCRDLDIAVPEHVAVIGVDDDERLCSLCTPALSSVRPDKRRTGYEAARMLDDLMHGVKVDATGLLIDPVGIAERRSTDILAIDDEEVVKAMRYIRHHALDGINVSDVLKHVKLSRRALEGRFQKYINRTPHSEIERVKMERVKQLLTETDLTLAAIAERTGYRHADYLAVAFKRYVGVQPGLYRSQRDA